MLLKTGTTIKNKNRAEIAIVGFKSPAMLPQLLFLWTISCTIPFASSFSSPVPFPLSLGNHQRIGPRVIEMPINHRNKTPLFYKVGSDDDEAIGFHSPEVTSNIVSSTNSIGFKCEEGVRRVYETFRWKNREDGGEYNINYRVEGPVDGPPILLIHGFGANVNHFRHQFPAFTKEGYRVYAIDMIGFGASDKPAHIDYSIELFTQLLTDFMLSMNAQMSAAVSTSIQKWVVAGNSIGGLCSLAVTEHLPSLVRGVVLFNCAGGMSAFRYEDMPLLWRPLLWFLQNIILGPSFGSYFFSQYKSRENVRSILQKNVYRDATNVDDELMQALLEPGEDEGAETVFLKVMAGPPGPTPKSILPNLDCPILALWGGADPWTSVNTGAHAGTKFHQYAKDFDLVVLPNVGHCPHDEAPDTVNGHMIPWMKKLR